jgi:hypothetical protein
MHAPSLRHAARASRPAAAGRLARASRAPRLRLLCQAGEAAAGAPEDVQR